MLLYIIQVKYKKETLIKIGHTEYLPDRLQEYIDLFGKVHVVKTYSDSNVDWKGLEEKLHTCFTDHNCKLDLTFNGCSEVYPSYMLKEIQDKLEVLKPKYLTNTVNTSGKFVKIPVSLMYSTYWKDQDGESFRLYSGLKMLYSLRLYEYNLRSYLNKDYTTSTQQIAKVLNIKESKAKEYENLLINMGLLERKVNMYKVYTIDNLKGELIKHG